MRISDWSSDVCSSDLTRLGGRDKAWLERAGKPLVLALARRLAPEVVATLVSANRNADHYLSHGLRAIHDRIADIGPLGGHEALADACPPPWLLTGPVDVVAVNDCLVRSLPADRQSVVQGKKGTV